jgi:hypothetical protein
VHGAEHAVHLGAEPFPGLVLVELHRLSIVSRR